MVNRGTIIAVIIAVIAVLATATAVYKLGYEQGFGSCIEENNLYERYGIDM